MPGLPRDLSGLEIIKILSKLGFAPICRKGSHVILEKIENNERWGCVVPMHKEVKLGTLKGILKQARLTEEEFLAEI